MQSDWKELIALLKSHDVEFLVVGAHALAVHARPRFTEDLDVRAETTTDFDSVLPECDAIMMLRVQF